MHLISTPSDSLFLDYMYSSFYEQSKNSFYSRAWYWHLVGKRELCATQNQILFVSLYHGDFAFKNNDTTVILHFRKCLLYGDFY